MPETYDIGPGQGTLQIKTGREGAAAKAGHDLTLEATAWQATVVVDRDTPSNSQLRATVEAGSIVVREGHGGAMPLTDGQRGDILKNINEKVLLTGRHPQITFVSRRVTGGGGAATVDGELTLVGVTRPVSLTLTASGPDARTIHAATSVVQTDYGIKRYSAMLGALKVRDEVEIVVDVTLPESS